MSIGILLFVALFAGLITAVTARFAPADSSYADGWAGALSLLWPGAGHIYKGYVGTGMLMMLAFVVCYGGLPGLAMLLHVAVIVHAIKVHLPVEVVREPERARCGVCGREFPEGELTTYDGRLWCADDYRTVLTAG